MYDSSTTVTVELDVHARSVRLAAVRADELLEEGRCPTTRTRSSRFCVVGWGCAAATRRARPASVSTGISSDAVSTAPWMLADRRHNRAVRAP
jgi:hypothetical protein